MGDYMNYKSVVKYEEYGRIIIDLKSIMTTKGVNRNKLSKSTNVRFEVIDKWYNGTISRLDLDVLARICYSLDCDAGDIIKYTKNSRINMVII